MSRSVAAHAPAVEPAKLLSITEVAGLLGVHRRTVEMLRAGGRFPREDLKVGKLPRWRPETVERWISEQSRGGR